MTENQADAAKKNLFKGGRKGGKLFPRVNLEQAVKYAKKLVAKTHTGAQPEGTILTGVFGNAGPEGKIRVSALKQYGLLEGRAVAYKATKLAKDIEASPEEDLPPLLHRAFLNAQVFNKIFDTFHGDTITRAKIEQRAKALGVHPESAAECGRLFIDSSIMAKLGTLVGDSLVLQTAGSVATQGEADSSEGDNEVGQQEDDATSIANREGQPESENLSNSSDQLDREHKGTKRLEQPTITLALTVDATSDPEKLEKQLKLLRQYGVI